MRYLLIIALLVLAFSCDNRSNKRPETPDTGFSEMMDVTATKQAAQPTGEPVAEQVTKKVVKTGGIEFQSDDIEADYLTIRELLPQYQAYIENENQYKSDQRIDYRLTIRVPSHRYDTLYGSLASFGVRVDNKYSNIEDVTEQYYDLKTRIKNKKALEDRYVQLLDQATEVKDILEIEKNLNAVRTEIERFEGQFNYLSKQVSLSTINLTFYEVLPYVYDASQRKGFGARILSALNNGWQSFLSFTVALISLWPFLFLIVAGVYLIRKVKQTWKKNK